MAPLAQKRTSFHPMMLEELSHRLELGQGDPARFMLLGSFLKEDFPWLYELGVDAYRMSVSGNPSRYKEARRRFLAGCDMLRHGPFIEMINDKEAHHAIREVLYLMDRYHIEARDERDCPDNG